MSGYRLTPAAQRDLSSIWDFTQGRWDMQQAEVYLVEIREAIERIAVAPERGRKIDQVRNGYRRYVVGSHAIFYRENGSYIDVIRILHQRMDPTLHL